MLAGKHMLLVVACVALAQCWHGDAQPDAMNYFVANASNCVGTAYPCQAYAKRSECQLISGKSRQTQVHMSGTNVHYVRVSSVRCNMRDVTCVTCLAGCQWSGSTCWVDGNEDAATCVNFTSSATECTAHGCSCKCSKLHAIPVELEVLADHRLQIHSHICAGHVGAPTTVHGACSGIIAPCDFFKYRVTCTQTQGWKNL